VANLNRMLAIRLVQWFGWVFETQERKFAMGGTWDRAPDGSLFRVLFFLFFLRGVAAVLITTKGDESPGSSRMGVIGALVIFSIWGRSG